MPVPVLRFKRDHNGDRAELLSRFPYAFALSAACAAASRATGTRNGEHDT